MRRSHLGTAVFATALALAGCTTTSTDGTADPSPTGSDAAPTPTPAAPAIEPRPLMSYPDTPTTAWTFAAQDSGVEADGELALVDPTAISWSLDAYPPFEPIDAGDVVATAVRAGFGPATLVGVDADSGTARWAYAPKEGQLDNCAREVLGAGVACAVAGPANEADAVVLIDAETGKELRRLDLPGAPLTLAVGAGLVVVLTDPDPQPTEGEPHTYELTAVDAQGEQRWSTPVVYTPSLGRGPTLDLGVGDALTALEFVGSVYVLTTDDGELVAQRDVGLDASGQYRNWGWAPLGDAVMLIDSDDEDGPNAVVIGADGAELATLTGYSWLTALVESDTTLFRAPDGQIVTIDPSTGEVDGTGVAPSDATTRAASEVDGMLLVRGDTVLAYDLDEPGSPAWEQEIALAVQFVDAPPDGSRLYPDALGGDEDAPDGALVYSALDLTDGSLPWSLTVEPLSEFDPPTVVRGGGRLIIMNGDTMTALAP